MDPEALLAAIAGDVRAVFAGRRTKIKAPGLTRSLHVNETRRATDELRQGAEQRLPLPLDARREAFETPIGLGRPRR